MATPPYFLFNGVDSRDMGVHVISYPPIIRPARRVKYIAIPGAAGDVCQEEGEWIYDPYERSMEISNARGKSIDAVRRWLAGRGTMILGSEPEFAYTVDLSARWQADRLLKGVWSGQLQMHTQPFKASAVTEADLQLASSGATVKNPGDIPAKPLITILGSGTVSITLGGVILALTGVESGWQIDTATGWILNAGGAPLFGVCTGDPRDAALPVGDSTVLFTGSVTKLIIRPRWRYL